MIKISDLISRYESIKPEGDMKLFFDEDAQLATIEKLKDIQKAIGDVTMEEEVLSRFMGISCCYRYETYMQYMKKIRILYELFKDEKMSIDDLGLLIACYEEGPYTLMFKEIKELIRTGQLSLDRNLFHLIEEAKDIARDEAAKLDDLKDEYGEHFIKILKYIVVDKCLSIDKVLEILPSKELIDSSSVWASGLNYMPLSGEEIVIRRLYTPEGEKEYQEAPLEARLKLNVGPHGSITYTSFTKREYEEDLKSKKILIRKK
jgi:hypothetical protein